MAAAAITGIERQREVEEPAKTTLVLFVRPNTSIRRVSQPHWQ